ncbi:BlaI/MecI/CopY family transcriptional regulator [Paenibacillus sp. P25]|nr:BlaI/MecI/CopY family transcriptional regulator [Paenibacillus sp. P25]
MEGKQTDILSKLLGPLELQVMRIIWDQGEAPYRMFSSGSVKKSNTPTRRS